MDSYNFHFERMNNLDLHPLSLPVSRLSPAKSTSSIDQYTHRHSKGDSAYSSFSGGSSAPDYPSPFLSDDFHAHSLHYADLKYVKAVYGPSILETEPKSMNHLYRSMEAIAHHHQQRNSSQVKDPNTALLPPPPPPPPPLRLDSFATTRSLDTSRVRQSPEGQVSDIFSLRPQTANPDIFCPRPDALHGRRVSQHRDQPKQDLESKSASTLSRLPLQTSQPEHSQQTRRGSQSEMEQKRSHPATEQQRTINSWHMAPNKISGSVQHKGQFYFVTGVYKSPETSVPQAQCAGDGSSLEPPRQAENQRAHSTMESMFKNVQWRKPSSPEGPNGKLFFQEEKQLSTPNEKEMPVSNHGFNHSGHSKSADEMADSQMVMSMDVGRHHTANHPIFYCGPEKTFSASTTNLSKIPIPGMTETAQNVHLQKEEHANRWLRHHLLVDVPRTFSTSTTSLNKTPGMTEMPENIHLQKEEDANRRPRHPLADVPTEKISKETTPLLYHLTGANRVSLINKVKNEKNSNMGCRDPEQSRDKQSAGKESASCSGESPHSGVANEDKLKESPYSCSTLDDSYRKYYKEKLKDAQTKVLRETSFKRKDLQLSRPPGTEQRTDKRPPVVPSGSPPKDVHSRMENPTQPHLSMLREPDKETLKNPHQEMEKGIEKDRERQQNIAQPQVARIGSRKRLSPAQKKLSHSEPEKLHQLGDGSFHESCRSLGSESEGLHSFSLAEDIFGEHGVVAARRKMFETRERALSVSSVSKGSLKHLQQKALVAYMERKTGQKVAEPQQPSPQVPPQRHSSARRHSDWVSRPQSANAGPKKKLLRPLSAGRILDSSSIRYAQVTPGQTSGHPRHSSWKEGVPLTPGKSASAENLPDEQPSSQRSHSTSAAPVSHQRPYPAPPEPPHDKDVISPHIEAEAEPTAYQHAASVPDQKQGRVMAPRGKSMEEIVPLMATKPKVLSKSTDQLHQLHKKHLLSKERRDGTFSVEKQEHTQQNHEQPPNTQTSPGQHQLYKDPCSSESPSTVSHSPCRALSTSTTFSGSEFGVPSCDDKPPLAFHNSGYSGKEVRSAPSSRRGSKDNSLDARTPEQSLTNPEVSPGDVVESQRPDSKHEVSLSLGVTTDPTMWILPPENDDSNANECTAQNTQPSPCAEMESALILSDTGVESDPALKEDQEPKVKDQKCDAPVEEKREGHGAPRWEVLVKEVVSADPSLARFLYPIYKRKTALMLMEQLLSEDTLLMEEHYKKKQEQKPEGPEHTTNGPEVADVEKVNSSSAPNEDGALLTPHQHTPNSAAADTTEKKRQLIAYIEEHLRSLEGERSLLRGEEQENGALGDAMEALVRQCCLPAELERYTQFIGDLERVVSLLLCLSARLARVQNALSTVDHTTDAEEKQSLDNRHLLLCKQREDAKDLKENLDRRERLVSSFLTRQLTEAQVQEYRRFVQTKASLLIRQKDLEEKQRLGEEQREALFNSITP